MSTADPNHAFLDRSDSGNKRKEFNISTKVTDLASIPKQLDRYKKDGIWIIKRHTGISSRATKLLIELARKRDILAIADLWSLNLNRIIMQTTGLDGWARSAG